MLKKRNKMSMLLAVIMLCLMWIEPVAAKNIQDNYGKESIDLYYLEASSAKTTLSISGGIASCTAQLTAKSKKRLYITLKIQKYTGGTWKTVQTWTKSGTGARLELIKTASVPQGYQYRTVATMKCGSENITKYSPVITC